MLRRVRAFLDSDRALSHPLRPDVTASQLEQIREASVLIPFHFPTGFDEPQILLTLRPTYLRRHAGQVSFPGGTREPADRSPRQTALRESWEEIGTPAEHIEVIGELRPLYLPSGYRITPVVGILAPDTRIRPCPVEVEAVFHAPARLLLDPASYQRSRMTFRDHAHDVLELRFQRYRIWGATAAILHGFGEAIRSAE